MALALTFLGFIVLRVTLVTLGGLMLVRPIRGCPACFQPTTPVLVRWLERLTRYEWRWCPACGWRGLSRRRRHHARPVFPGPPRQDSEPTWM